jgi:hypothetical protein
LRLTLFSTNNFIPNSITFGFSAGDASSEFIGAPVQTFYAPITLNILPGTEMYRLQFNVTVTNAGPLPYSASLAGADFASANLTQATLDGAELARANFGAANLSNAGFAATNLTGAAFWGTNLSNADLTNARISGASVGKSLVEADQVEEMKALLAKAAGKILLPLDHVASDRFDFKAMTAGRPQTTPGADIPEGLLGLDIGPKTVAEYGKVIASAKTVVWNGPMGVFEIADYAQGTKAVAQAVAAATDRGAVSVIGGGDSAAAVEEMGLDARMTHISTGGGASLELLEGKVLPGIAALTDRK